MGKKQGRLPNLVIRASAGTGKTFQLSNRFLKLAASGEPPDTILATTFTRKAAGEILSRVLLRLAEGAMSPSGAAALAQQLGEPGLDQARCQGLLASLVRQLHRLRIGTLDSFFLQMARSFSLELGLPPGWQIAEETDLAALRTEAIRAVIGQQDTSQAAKLMRLLSKGQVSRSISEQVSELVAELYGLYAESSPQAWEALGFAKPLKPEEYEQALGEFAAADCSADRRLATAREKALECLRAEDWQAALTEGLLGRIAAGNTSYHNKPLPPPLVQAGQKLAQHCQAMWRNQVAVQTEATGRLLALFDAEYQRLKLAYGVLHFDDVARKLAESPLLARVDDLDFRLDGHVAHLMLDEFQDTSALQWRVLRPLAQRVAGPDGRSSFFCVGDVKQAIYGWRGGLAEIFDALEKELPNLSVQSLALSRRSSPVVIEVVNRVFQDLREHVQQWGQDNNSECGAAAYWQQRFSPHQTARENLPGYCELVTAPAAQEGEVQRAVTCRYAAQLIQRLTGEAPECTIGVLARKNDTVARLIYELRQLGVEASEEGGTALSDSAPVQSVLSLLTLADHPGDTTARFHLAHTPLGRALGLVQYDDLEAACRLSAEVRRRLLECGYGPAVAQWVDRVRPYASPRDQMRLEQLVEMAYGYDGGSSLRCDDFVQWVQQSRVESPRPARVRVMTIHQAKGLEFDIVVLPELDVKLLGQSPQLVAARDGPAGPIHRVLRYVSKKTWSLLPADFQHLFEHHEQTVAGEAFCLLYVAMTRAIHVLHMVIPPSAPNEKKLPKTYVGLLRAALTDGRPLPAEKRIFRHGDPRWYKKLRRAAPPGTTAPAAAQPPSMPQPVALRLAPPEGQVARGLQRLGPSALEGGGQVYLLHRLRLESAEVLDRGTLLHAWMGQIGWLEDGLPDDAALRQVAIQLQLARRDLDAELAEFRSLLGKRAIRSVLSRATYQSASQGAKTTPVHATAAIANPHWEVFREWPFAIRDGDTLLSGKVDRLVVLYDGTQPVGADIVDYKTDQLPNDPGAVNKRVEYYRPQMEGYRKAVIHWTGLPAERVSARLLFLYLGRTVMV